MKRFNKKKILFSSVLGAVVVAMPLAVFAPLFSTNVTIGKDFKAWAENYREKVVLSADDQYYQTDSRGNIRYLSNEDVRKVNDEINNSSSSSKIYSTSTEIKKNLIDEDCGIIDPTWYEQVKDTNLSSVKVYRANDDAVMTERADALETFINSGYEIYNFNGIYFKQKTDLFQYLKNVYLNDIENSAVKTIRIKSPTGEYSRPINLSSKEDWKSTAANFIQENCKPLVKVATENGQYKYISVDDSSSLNDDIDIDDINYIKVTDAGSPNWVVGTNVGDEYDFNGPTFYRGHSDMSRGFSNPMNWETNGQLDTPQYVDEEYKLFNQSVDTAFRKYIDDGSLVVGANDTMVCESTSLFATTNSSYSLLGYYNDFVSEDDLTNSISIEKADGEEKTFTVASLKTRDSITNNMIEKYNSLLQRHFNKPENAAYKWILSDAIKAANTFRTNKNYNFLFRVPFLYSFMIDRLINAGASNELINVVVEYFKTIADIMTNIVKYNFGPAALEPAIGKEVYGQLDFAKIYNIGSKNINFNIARFQTFFAETYPNLAIAMQLKGTVDSAVFASIDPTEDSLYDTVQSVVELVIPSANGQVKNQLIIDGVASLRYQLENSTDILSNKSLVAEAAESDAGFAAMTMIATDNQKNILNRNKILDIVVDEASELINSPDSWEFVPNDNRFKIYAYFLQQTKGLQLTPRDVMATINISDRETLTDWNHAFLELEELLTKDNTYNEIANVIASKALFNDEENTDLVTDELNEFYYNKVDKLNENFKNIFIEGNYKSALNDSHIGGIYINLPEYVALTLMRMLGDLAAEDTLYIMGNYNNFDVLTINPEYAAAATSIVKDVWENQPLLLNQLALLHKGYQLIQEKLNEEKLALMTSEIGDYSLDIETTKSIIKHTAQYAAVMNQNIKYLTTKLNEIGVPTKTGQVVAYTGTNTAYHHNLPTVTYDLNIQKEINIFASDANVVTDLNTLYTPVDTNAPVYVVPNMNIKNNLIESITVATDVYLVSKDMVESFDLINKAEYSWQKYLDVSQLADLMILDEDDYILGLIPYFDIGAEYFTGSTDDGESYYIDKWGGTDTIKVSSSNNARIATASTQISTHGGGDDANSDEIVYKKKHRPSKKELKHYIKQLKDELINELKEIIYIRDPITGKYIDNKNTNFIKHHLFFEHDPTNIEELLTILYKEKWAFDFEYKLFVYEEGDILFRLSDNKAGILDVFHSDNDKQISTKSVLGNYNGHFFVLTSEVDENDQDNPFYKGKVKSMYVSGPASAGSNGNGFIKLDSLTEADFYEALLTEPGNFPMKNKAKEKDLRKLFKGMDIEKCPQSGVNSDKPNTFTKYQQKGDQAKAQDKLNVANANLKENNFDNESNGSDIDLIINKQNVETVENDVNKSARNNKKVSFGDVTLANYDKGSTSTNIYNIKTINSVEHERVADPAADKMAAKAKHGKTNIFEMVELTDDDDDDMSDDSWSSDEGSSSGSGSDWDDDLTFDDGDNNQMVTDFGKGYKEWSTDELDKDRLKSVNKWLDQVVTTTNLDSDDLIKELSFYNLDDNPNNLSAEELAEIRETNMQKVDSMFDSIGIEPDDYIEYTANHGTTPEDLSLSEQWEQSKEIIDENKKKNSELTEEICEKINNLYHENDVEETLDKKLDSFSESVKDGSHSLVDDDYKEFIDKKDITPETTKTVDERKRSFKTKSKDGVNLAADLAQDAFSGNAMVETSRPNGLELNSREESIVASVIQKHNADIEKKIETSDLKHKDILVLANDNDKMASVVEDFQYGSLDVGSGKEYARIDATPAPTPKVNVAVSTGAGTDELVASVEKVDSAVQTIKTQEENKITQANLAAEELNQQNKNASTNRQLSNVLYHSSRVENLGENSYQAQNEYAERKNKVEKEVMTDFKQETDGADTVNDLVQTQNPSRISKLATILEFGLAFIEIAGIAFQIYTLIAMNRKDEKAVSYMFKTDDATWSWSGGKRLVSAMDGSYQEIKTASDMKLNDPVLVSHSFTSDFYYYNGFRYSDDKIGRSNLKQAYVNDIMMNRSSNVNMVYTFNDVGSEPIIASGDEQIGAYASVDELSDAVINDIENNSESNYINDEVISFNDGYFGDWSGMDVDGIRETAARSIISTIRPTIIGLRPILDANGLLKTRRVSTNFLPGDSYNPETNRVVSESEKRAIDNSFNTDDIFVIDNSANDWNGEFVQANLQTAVEASKTSLATKMTDMYDVKVASIDTYAPPHYSWDSVKYSEIFNGVSDQLKPHDIVIYQNKDGLWHFIGDFESEWNNGSSAYSKMLNFALNERNIKVKVNKISQDRYAYNGEVFNDLKSFYKYVYDKWH